MRVILTKEEINLEKQDNGLFDYKLNGIKVEGFNREMDAINHAEESFSEFLTGKYIKKMKT